MFKMKRISTQNRDRLTSGNGIGIVNTAIYSKREVAALLGVTPRYLERVIASGKLRVFKPSRKLVRISGKDVAAWLDAHASIAA
jgi:excisionase family DNA binding protein